VSHIAFSPSDTYMATCGEDSRINIYDMRQLNMPVIHMMSHEKRANEHDLPIGVMCADWYGDLLATAGYVSLEQLIAYFFNL